MNGADVTTFVHNIWRSHEASDCEDFVTREAIWRAWMQTMTHKADHSLRTWYRTLDLAYYRYRKAGDS